MKLPRRINRSFVACLVVGLICVVAGRVVINETTIADWIVRPLIVPDTPGRADAIVVLGAAVIGDCVPNLNGVRRVALGARLWREHRAPIVALTGGPADAPCPVSLAMAHFAHDMGVPESSLLIERHSESTWENGELTAPLLRRAGVKRVLVVTDRLHMRRAAGVFARLGFEVETAGVPIPEGHVDNVDMLAAGMREFVALAYYRAKGRIAPVTPVEPRHAAVPEESARGTTGVAHVPAGSVMHQKPSNPSGPLVLLGASYAKGWVIDGLNGIPVVNAGVSGQQSFEMLERFERDVVAVRPRAVILWGFINDIFRARDIDASLQRVRDSYTAMVERARAAGIEPILATEVTVRAPDSWTETILSFVGGLMGKESYQDQINRNVLAINGWLSDLAAREQLLLIDLHGALADEDGRRRRREFIDADGTHITREGYDALTRYAAPILYEHLTQRMSPKTQ